VKITRVVDLRNTLLIGASLLPFTVLAHHSRAHYGQEIVELDAEIVEIDWRNPHVTFTMKAMNAAGKAELWELEGGSTYMLSRYSGLGRDLFNVGDQVKIAGPISAIRLNEMLVTNILLPDGKEALMLPNRPPRWSDQIEGTKPTLQTNNPERSLFHVWSIDPVAPGGAGGSNISMTEGAKAALSAYDIDVDAPALRCVKPGMPSTMSNPHPIHFVDEGDRIIVYIQENDVVRTIYLSENTGGAAVPPSPLGYSVGHWENTTLVVRTTNINWPYLDRTGIPLSEEVIVIERFEINQSGSRMVNRIITTDPVSFTAPITSQRHYALLGEPVKTYDCVAR
jgi:hypothetical protein